MINKDLKIDKLFLTSVILLTTAGFVIFTSASLGLLARDGASFELVAIKQGLGLILGIIAFFIMSKIDYKKLKRNSFYIFAGAVVLNLLLFIPALSQNHGGATRWINLGFITFQPSEFLKIAFIIYFSAWLTILKDKIRTLKYGTMPFIIIISVLSLILLAQKDTDTLVVITITGISMLFVAQARIRHIALVMLMMFIALAGVVYMRPYARDRVMTFFNNTSDSQGSSYQIQQSLIAIGSGRILGRGFGQSVQKFNYLPEPIGDSIFAVGAEEFGFMGSIIIIMLFLFFFVRSMKITQKLEDGFGGLIVIGIAILILTESFMNISSMLGIIPLSGMPLLFISHGGTALITTLASTGIIANISKYKNS